MAKEEDWIKSKQIGNDCVELCYVETDKTGVYVIKQTMDKDRNIIKRIKDVILDFPIEIIEMKTIKELGSPYGKYGQRIYRISINGKESISTVKQARLLIQKKVRKWPFYSKYGFKFRAYIRMALWSQEKKLEKMKNEIKKEVD